MFEFPFTLEFKGYRGYLSGGCLARGGARAFSFLLLRQVTNGSQNPHKSLRYISSVRHITKLATYDVAEDGRPTFGTDNSTRSVTLDPPNIE
jgi:hypothetical protein